MIGRARVSVRVSSMTVAGLPRNASIRWDTRTREVVTAWVGPADTALVSMRRKEALVPDKDDNAQESLDDDIWAASSRCRLAGLSVKGVLTRTCIAKLHEINPAWIFPSIYPPSHIAFTQSMLLELYCENNISWNRH